MAQYLYLVLCILGTVLPCSQLLPFLNEHGLNVSLLIKDLFANRISGFFGLDIIVSSIVLWVLVFRTLRRNRHTARRPDPGIDRYRARWCAPNRCWAACTTSIRSQRRQRARSSARASASWMQIGSGDVARRLNGRNFCGAQL